MGFFLSIAWAPEETAGLGGKRWRTLSSPIATNHSSQRLSQ
jgi:hypothetical protein